MKFKFNPQTSILVAGIVAATYAEACNFAQTSMRTICYSSGTPVDQIAWQDGTGGFVYKNVTTTADWVQGYQWGAEQYLESTVTSAGIGTGHVGTGSTTKPSYCFGPAQFQDLTGHTDSVPYWQNNVATPGFISVPNNPQGGGSWGTTSGSTCM